MARLNVFGLFLTTPLLILIGSGVVFSCTIALGHSSEPIVAESLQAIRTFHFLSVTTSSIVAIIFLIRRPEGWVSVLLCSGALLVSPGWNAEKNANILPNCEPAYVNFVRVMFLITVTALAIQTAQIFLNRRKREQAEDVTHSNQVT